MRHSIRLIAWTIALLSILSIAKVSHAASKGHIELKTIVQKEVVELQADGKQTRTLVDAGTVTPKDEVIYTIFFTNVREQPVENIVIVDKVPPHTFYKADSAFGPATKVSFSVDGGKSFATPDSLRIRDSDGTERLARPTEYSHVRWVYEPELKKGQRGYVRFRAIVK
ncbi:MAG: hypothetical protein AAF493_12205 [Pseudomonadota bacterium]